MGELIERFLALPGIRTIKAVADRFGADGAGFLTGAIAYAFFISMVPLLLLGLSLLGYVLQATGVGERVDVVEAVTEEIPGLADLFSQNVQSLINLKTWAGVFAILGIIWAGTGGVNAIRHSLGVIYRVTQRPNLLLERLIALALLIVLLIALVGSAVAATYFRRSAPLTAIGLPATALFNIGVVFLVCRMLMPKAEVASRYLWRGAIIAGIGFAGLALLGAWYTERVVVKAAAIYGTFAGLVGILVILNLAAVFLLVGAEYGAVCRENDGEHEAANPA